MTPLHCTAKTNNHLDLFEKFLLVCLDSIIDLMTRNEVALHVALKYDKLEAFKYLVGWLVKNRFLLE